MRFSPPPLSRHGNDKWEFRARHSSPPVTPVLFPSLSLKAPFLLRRPTWRRKFGPFLFFFFFFFYLPCRLIPRPRVIGEARAFFPCGFFPFPSVLDIPVTKLLGFEVAHFFPLFFSPCYPPLESRFRAASQLRDPKGGQGDDVRFSLFSSFFLFVFFLFFPPGC